MIDTAEDLIRQYVNFNYGVANGGWNVTYCEVCGDGSRTKGPRGGFNFIDAGNTVFYHCFNCGIKGDYSLDREISFSKNMKNILSSFGIPATEFNALLLAKQKDTIKKPVNSVQISHKILDIPDYFASLKDSQDESAQNIKKFLKDNYALSTKDYSFLYATGITKVNDPQQKAFAKSIAGRLIIPYYKNGKLIYYDARDITNTHKLKYISANIPKTNILFNIDQLYRKTDDPMYVVEGAMDAIHLNAVATLGNEMSAQQVKMLATSSRRKILVPDFNGDSNKLLHQFISNGWEVSTPAYGRKYKDVSEAIVNYGKLFVAHDIASNIQSAKTAEIMFEIVNRR